MRRAAKSIPLLGALGALAMLGLSSPAPAATPTAAANADRQVEVPASWLTPLRPEGAKAVQVPTEGFSCNTMSGNADNLNGKETRTLAHLDALPARLGPAARLSLVVQIKTRHVILSDAAPDFHGVRP